MPYAACSAVSDVVAAFLAFSNWVLIAARCFFAAAWASVTIFFALSNSAFFGYPRLSAPLWPDGSSSIFELWVGQVRQGRDFEPLTALVSANSWATSCRPHCQTLALSALKA